MQEGPRVAFGPVTALSGLLRRNLGRLHAGARGIGPCSSIRQFTGHLLQFKVPGVMRCMHTLPARAPSPYAEGTLVCFSGPQSMPHSLSEVGLVIPRQYIGPSLWRSVWQMPLLPANVTECKTAAHADPLQVPESAVCATLGNAAADVAAKNARLQPFQLDVGGRSRMVSSMPTTRIWWTWHASSLRRGGSRLWRRSKMSRVALAAPTPQNVAACPAQAFPVLPESALFGASVAAFLHSAIVALGLPWAGPLRVRKVPRSVSRT